MNILYLVHDISDAAVSKRISMLHTAGAAVNLAGFRRHDKIKEISGALSVIDLGRTYNAGFKQRILAVLKVIFSLRSYKTEFRQKDVIIARNLEMLIIAICIKTFLYKNPKPVVIYESLDIHRLLLKQNIVGKIMRGIERFLTKRSDGLITSSPAFIEEYFTKIAHLQLPIKLVENKVFIPNKSFSTKTKNKDVSRPWRIGWFGILRCAESMNILVSLLKRHEGNIEIILRGKPAYDQIPDFDKIVSSTDGLEFKGAYTYPDDLKEMYEDIDFTWAIDRFEKGLNSSWLLPNRLYEGCLFNAVPIAEKNVEIGKFIERHEIGISLENPLPDTLNDFFQTLSIEDYKSMKKAVSDIPKEKWLMSKDECTEILSWMSELKIQKERTA